MRDKWTPENAEPWPERDDIFRHITKEVYGEYFDDEKIEELRRIKLGEQKPSVKMMLGQLALIPVMYAKGFRSKNVFGKIDTILETLPPEERATAELASGVKAHMEPSPTRDQIAEQMNITRDEVESLVASAAHRFAPATE